MSVIAILGLAVDLAVIWLLWRQRGKPLPAQMEKWRAVPVLRWFLNRISGPVMSGY